jgi:hypothetical protein
MNDPKRIRPGGLEFSKLSAPSLRAIALSSQFDAVALADGANALEALRSKSAGDRAQLADALLGKHALALNQGRVQEALTDIAALPARLADPHSAQRLRVLDALYGDGDTLVAREAARELGQLVANARLDHRRSSPASLADQCVMAQWYASRLDTARVAMLLPSLRKAAAGSSTATVPASPCVYFVDAELAVMTRPREGPSRLAQLDSLAWTPRVIGDLAAYAPLWLARLHERLGDDVGALESIRRRQYMSDWSPFLAAMWREEGRYAESVGDHAGALSAYHEFLALRTSPDRRLKPQTDSIRAEVATSEKSPAR